MYGGWSGRKKPEFVANCITVGGYTVYLHGGIELVPRITSSIREPLHVDGGAPWLAAARGRIC